MESSGLARRVGLWLGLVAFAVVLVLPAPAGLDAPAWRTAAVAALMAVWWMTEAIPIPATALLPLVLFPTLGILDMPSAAAPYAAEIIFLFMGGFFLAMAMERWGLHRRIALAIVDQVGTSPKRIILGFMVGTAFLSMWISNTATATMMLPIALAVAEMFRPQDTEGPFEFGIALMLGIAYAASIGGVATLIGTPPNAILAAATSEILGEEIGFIQWMAVGLPVTIIFLPVTWFILTFVLFPTGEVSGDAAEILHEERTGLGRMNRGERIVAVVFVAAVLAWLFRSTKVFGDVTIPGIQAFAPWVRDSTIAMAAAMILFMAPVDRAKGVMALDWPTARRIPWGVLLLFGGGLSLARAMDQTGLAEWIGGGVAGLGSVPPWLIVAAVAGMFVFLTEVTSNAATTTMGMPIMAGAALSLGMPGMTLMATAAMAASMAFMLPVATPPNAIVFGSGYLTVQQMARAGIVLNLLAIVLITIVATLLVPAFLVS
jgi:sodium-dependent dicarboxylate transporter 2/3/5